MVTQNSIAIIDPGLMERGGHHAALLFTLAASPQRPAITIFAHKAIDRRLISLANEHTISVNPHFSIDFYEIIARKDGLSTRQCNEYLGRLSQQYAQALKQISATVIFLPCVSWEHLTAFVAAKRSTPCDAKVKACLMFSPGVNHRGEIRDREEAKRYKIACNMALRESIELFASDTAVQAGLNPLCYEELTLHPCYLANWSELPIAVPRPKSHLLYFGDAKPDKGFNRLPALARKLLRDSDPQLTAHIHFTQNWDIPEIDDTKRALTELADNDSRLTISSEYLDTEELANLLGRTNYLYQLYQLKPYLNKSSGIDWWIQFYDHLQIVPHHLGKERLGVGQQKNKSIYFQSLIPWLLRPSKP